MKKQYLELDNTCEVGSADVGASFTLRGNSNMFNHMYEYAKLNGKVPLHHLNMKFGRTNADTMYDLLVSFLADAFPEGKFSYRRIFDINMHDVPKSMRDVSDIGELFSIEGTGITTYIYRTGNHHLSAEVFVGTDLEYDVMRQVVALMTEKYERVDEPFKDKFYMISNTGQNLVLLEYTVNKDKFDGFDINLLYNDDFKPVSETIQTTLAKKDGTTGIVLLHGVVGSAKTTYLRHLISTLKKRVIYMPPDMAHELSSPTFFNFIRQYPNSILIIEDAEGILRTREQGTNTAISNILNMTDGIMGDALNIQIVCTFNADIEEIDKAILRPGRLIANHFFDFLTKEKTLALVRHLYGEDAVPFRDKMTVGEIYTMKSIPPSNVKPKRKGIGFTANM